MNNSLKVKVTNYLIKHGNNPADVSKMIDLHFEYASRTFSTVRKIAECIRTIY